MSSDSPVIEVAEEALEKHLDILHLDDEQTVDGVQSEDTKIEKKPRRVRLSEEERRKIWEEEQAKKPVLETGVSGKVKWYSILGHYGFIERDDEGKDVFVHQTAIAQSKLTKFFLRTLADGEEVVFDIVDGDKGPEAANVTGPDGSCVLGSRFFRILLRPRNIATKKDEKQEDKAEMKEKTGVTEEKSPKKKSKKSKNYRRKKTERKEETDSEAPKEAAGGRRRHGSGATEEKSASVSLAAGDSADLGASEEPKTQTTE